VSENRRDARYAARIVAKVVRRGETLELLTNDVSFRGAFLRTDAPPALRQLVRVTFALPSGEVVGGHAMVVHVVNPGAAAGEQVPGAGLQFWGPLDHGKTWEEFIRELRTRESAGAPAARVPDKVRRASERFKLAIDVELDHDTVVTRDVSETGMAIRTDSPMQVGMRCQVRLRAGKEHVTADVVVRRQIAERAFTGLGVEFVEMSDEAKRGLIAFLKKHAPKDDAIFVSPDDPKLQ
jgi:hypothetical protein